MRNDSRLLRDGAIAEERLGLDKRLSELKNKLLKDEVFLKICAISKVIDGSEILGSTLRQLFLDTPYPISIGEAKSIVNEILKEKEV
jgi:hypothetical protein